MTPQLHEAKLLVSKNHLDYTRVKCKYCGGRNAKCYICHGEKYVLVKH